MQSSSLSPRVKRFVDHGSGLVYFYDRTTGETSWVPPIPTFPSAAESASATEMHTMKQTPGSTDDVWLAI